METLPQDGSKPRAAAHEAETRIQAAEYEIRCLQFPQQEEAIENAFHSLETGLGDALTAFQTWEWFLHHVTGRQSSAEILTFVFVATRNGRVCAIFPVRGPIDFRVGLLSIRSFCLPYERLFASCAPSLSEVDTTVLLTAARRALRKRLSGWDAMILPRQLPESAFFSFRRLPVASRILNWKTGAIHWLATSGRYEEYQAGLSKNFRANLKKCRNKLATRKVEYLRCSATDAEFQDAVDMFFKLEASGWKKLTDARRPAYHALLAAGWARIDLMKIDSVVAAATLSFEKPANRLYVYKIAYNEDLSSVSPGILLTEHLVRECFENSRIGVLDLLSDGGWHLPFKPNSYELRTTAVFRLTWRAMLAVASLGLVRAARPLRLAAKWLR